jgi:hypothetical protein
MADSRYMKTKTVWQVVRTDGKILNFSVGNSREDAEKDLASGRYDKHLSLENAAYVREHTYETEVAAYEKVLIDSEIPEEHWPLLRADMQRALNMARDAGRPSDAMRSAVRAFKNGTLTPESFAASKPSNHYPKDRG